MTDATDKFFAAVHEYLPVWVGKQLEASAPWLPLDELLPDARAKLLDAAEEYAADELATKVINPVMFMFQLNQRRLRLLEARARVCEALLDSVVVQQLEDYEPDDVLELECSIAALRELEKTR